MPYHLHLTLQQRAMMSIAISIWNHQKVKDKIAKWADNHAKLEIDGARDEWRQLTSAVLKKLDQIVFLPPLRNELIHVIRELGERIYNWYIYIWYEYSNVYQKKGDMKNYIREIYWTPIGTVDEVKILQAYWLNNPELDVAVMYNIACQNALEEDMDDLWQRIPSDMKDDYGKFNNYEIRSRLYEHPNYDYLIFSYWKYRRDGRMDHFVEYAVSDDQFRNGRGEVVYDLDHSAEHNIFFLSVYKGYSTAAKYFWKKLTQEERDSGILYFAYISVIRTLDYIPNCIKEKHAETLIFLINHMTINQKESFLRGESVQDVVNDIGIKDVQEGILSMLSSTWPWQELFIPVLNDMLKYLDHNTEPILTSLYTISQKMAESGYVGECSKYQSLLYEAWFVIPGSMKRTMVQSNTSFCLVVNHIDKLLKVEDLSCIEMIFNDPDVRTKYIELGNEIYQTLIQRNQYELLDRFMETVSRSEEEKIYLKSVMNHLEMCEHFLMTGKYDSVDKLLNWHFETVEERKQCKNSFKNDAFFIHLVLTILSSCGGSMDEAKEKSGIYLKWLLESEDDIVCYKKEIIEYSRPLIERRYYYGGYSLHILSEEEEVHKIQQLLA